MLRRKTLLLAGVAAAGLVVGGCSDGGSGTAPTTTSTAATSSTPTTSVPAGATAGCADRDGPALGRPADAAVSADVDGDGRVDSVVVTVVDDATMEVVVDHGAGGHTVLTMDDDNVFTVAAVRIERVVDIDSDGDDDLWVVIGSGASTEVLGLVLADGCDLTRARADGAPNAFVVGASVGATAGIECTRDDDVGFEGFWHHEGEGAGEGTYAGTSQHWAVEGATLVRDATDTFAIDATAGDVEAYASLVCG